MAFCCGTQMLVSLLVIFCAVIINGELTYTKKYVKECAGYGELDCPKFNLKKYKHNGVLHKEPPMSETGLLYVEDFTALETRNTSGNPSGCCETLQTWTMYFYCYNVQNDYCYIIQWPYHGGLYQYTPIGQCGESNCYSGECSQQYKYVSMLAYCPRSGFGFYWFEVPAYCQCEGY